MLSGRVRVTAKGSSNGERGVSRVTEISTGGNLAGLSGSCAPSGNPRAGAIAIAIHEWLDLRGPPGASASQPPVGEAVERFLTPGYPRTMTVAVRVGVGR
ncbi:MAG TPA: hypothetical protein VJ596_08385 [Gemmatimonadaceae bacterium]|nr:hypothetical protein [Gemmatimonadaceae bacterium]